MSDLKIILEKVASMGAMVERFLVDHGDEYRGRQLPKTYRRGPDRMCFMTCANLAIHNRRVTYVEGFGAIKSLGNLPMHHAWCLDEKGRVIEPTWQDWREITYVGIKIDTELLCSELLRTKNYGVLYWNDKANENFIKRWKKHDR